MSVSCQTRKSAALFDQLVGGSKQGSRHCETELVGGLVVDANSNLTGCCVGRSLGFSPLRMRSTYDAARRYWPVASMP